MREVTKLADDERKDSRPFLWWCRTCENWHEGDSVCPLEAWVDWKGGAIWPLSS